MKRIIITVALLVFAVLLTVPCRAVDYVQKYKELIESGGNATLSEFLTGEPDNSDGGRVEEFLDSLPDELRDDVYYSGDAKDAAEKYDLKYFVSLIFKKLTAAAGDLILPTSLILVLIIAAFLVKTFLPDGTGGDAVSWTIRLAIVVASSVGGLVSFEAVSKFLNLLSAVSVAAIPIAVSLLVASGGVGVSSAGAAFVTAYSGLVEKVFSGVALPLLALSTSLCFAESVFPGGRLNLSSFMRKTAVWITVAVSTVSSFVFGIQLHLAGAADTLTLKSAKFALGSAVPFVGGALGDTLSAITAGASSVKSVFGIVLLVSLAAALLTPVSYLVLGKLSLSASSVLASALGGEYEGKLLSDLSSTVGCMIALCVFSSAVFMVVTVSFISYGAGI